MIDQYGSAQQAPAARRPAADLPVPPPAARALLLAAVFVCAACGLVYELELIALASYLVGDSVTQASVVLSVMVFAMGCGSLLAKRLRSRAAVGFAVVEGALALVGGLSVMALYACFAWYGQARPAMVGCAFLIGLLIGAEVPLLMTLVQRVRRQDAGGAVADLFAADYVGALVGGLAFPFVLLPYAGQLTGALFTGMVNAVAGGATVLWLFRADLSLRARGWLLVAGLCVLALLVGAAVAAGPFERAARRAVYGGQVRLAEHTGVQEIVVTGGDRPQDAAGLRLFLDGRLRVCGADTRPYHRALVDAAMAAGPHRRVLVLGGGDGLALREVLRHPRVRAVTVVEVDAALVRLARHDPGLAALNGHAFADGRVRTVARDLFEWVRRAAGPAGAGPYDVIVADLPEPGSSAAASSKLYSEEFYGLAARSLAPGGRLAVPGGRSPHALWTLDATLRAVGLRPVPYEAAGAAPPAPPAAPAPSAPGCPGRSGMPPGAPAPWPFLLAARPGTPLPGGLPAPRLPRPDHALPPSTLLHPRL
jgi:spermidine synthase